MSILNKLFGVSVKPAEVTLVVPEETKVPIVVPTGGSILERKLKRAVRLAQSISNLQTNPSQDSQTKRARLQYELDAITKELGAFKAAFDLLVKE